MKLYYSNTSPYSRKARLMVFEKGLTDRVEMQLCNPFGDITELLTVNPLGKIPTLVTDDGEAIYDSPVICEYLDSIGDGPTLLPIEDPARWRVLRWQALADGVIDLAYNIVMERRRGSDEQCPRCIDDWLGQMDRAVSQVETQIKELSGPMDLGQLALISALEYLDFRIKDSNWRSNCPATARWLAAYAERDSVLATRPFDPA